MQVGESRDSLEVFQYLHFILKSISAVDFAHRGTTAALDDALEWARLAEVTAFRILESADPFETSRYNAELAKLGRLHLLEQVLGVGDSFVVDPKVERSNGILSLELISHRLPSGFTKSGGCGVPTNTQAEKDEHKDKTVDSEGSVVGKDEKRASKDQCRILPIRMADVRGARILVLSVALLRLTSCNAEFPEPDRTNPADQQSQEAAGDTRVQRLDGLSFPDLLTFLLVRLEKTLSSIAEETRTTQGQGSSGDDAPHWPSRLSTLRFMCLPSIVRKRQRVGSELLRVIAAPRAAASLDVRLEAKAILLLSKLVSEIGEDNGLEPRHASIARVAKIAPSLIATAIVLANSIRALLEQPPHERAVCLSVMVPETVRGKLILPDVPLLPGGTLSPSILFTSNHGAGETELDLEQAATVPGWKRVWLDSTVDLPSTHCLCSKLARIEECLRLFIVSD